MNEKQAKEQERAAAAALVTAKFLQENRAWNWSWPGSGSECDGVLPDGTPLQRNCWFTANSKPRYTSKAPGSSQRIYGTQAYYGVPKGRKNKRASRRSSKRLSGLRMSGRPRGQGHSYPASTAGR